MAIEPIEQFAFNPATGWNDSDRFPTYEDNEEQVRADLQELHDQTRDYINSLRDYLERYTNDKVSETQAGMIEPDSIGEAALKGNAISTAKIQPGAVTTEKLADAAVTTGKIADEAVGIGKVDFVAQSVTDEVDKVPSSAAVLSKIAASVMDRLREKAGTYVGNGRSINEIDFGLIPCLVVVFSTAEGLVPSGQHGLWKDSFLWVAGQTRTAAYVAPGGTAYFAYPNISTGSTQRSLRIWNGATAAEVFNENGVTYHYFAIGL